MNKQIPTLIKTLSLITYGLSASISAQAEGSGSHGGNGVVCFANKPSIANELMKNSKSKSISVTIPDEYLNDITSVQVLELYDAESGALGENLTTTVALKPGETSFDYQKRITARFSSWNPILEENINEGKNMIGNRIMHVRAATLIPVEDIRPMTLPRSGCVYTNIARQEFIGSAPIKKMVIDDRLLDIAKREDPRNEAILMIHEYLEAFNTFKLKHEDAEGTIAMVSRMIAQNVDASEMSTILTSYGVKDLFLGEKAMPRALFSYLTGASESSNDFNSLFPYIDFETVWNQDFVQNHWSDFPRSIRRNLCPATITTFATIKNEHVDLNALKGLSGRISSRHFEKVNALFNQYLTEYRIKEKSAKAQCLQNNAEKLSQLKQLAQKSINQAIIGDAAKEKLLRALDQIPICTSRSGGIPDEARFNSSELHFE